MDFLSKFMSVYKRLTHVLDVFRTEGKMLANIMRLFDDGKTSARKAGKV